MTEATTAERQAREGCAPRSCRSSRIATPVDIADVIAFLLAPRGQLHHRPERWSSRAGSTRSILNHAPGVAATPKGTVDEGVAVLSAEHRQPRRDRGGHGRHDPHFYQRMLQELSEQIKLGDELGYDSISFTEHHFHIEGFELSNNPVLLDLYFAMQTKRIRVGQLGIVLPAPQPDPRRRRHRHARPHDRRPRQRGLRARLPAPLGRRHGAADARHPRRAAQPARRDRRRQPRWPSRRTSASSRSAGPRRC